MADKIYQVWRAYCEDTVICFASTDYDAVADYVVSVIIDCEKKRITDYAARCKAGDHNLAILDAQISALKSIADNITVKPILDELIEKQKLQATYVNWRNQANTTIHTVDYYRKHLTKYCNMYKIVIFDFAVNTELDTYVYECVDKVMQNE